MTNLLDLDAGILSEKIKAGEVRITSAVEAYINHLKKVNPIINALVQARFTAAMEEAQEKERLLARGRVTGRLFGVPISVKESFDVAGMRTTGGLLHRKDAVAPRDGDAIALLRREGAIILGKTNTPTICFAQETDNKLFGQTNNPWDLTRTAGGSSGGEAALIAVGGAAVGIGSDIGGSIRFPSHFNGVIGFKSGNKQVSDKGHFPPTHEPLQQRMLGLGAISKSVADAELLNDLISSFPTRKNNPSQFRLTVLSGQPGIPLSEKTETTLDTIKELLSFDYRVDELLPPYFDQYSSMWQLIMSHDEGKGMVANGLNETNFNPGWEYLKEIITGKSEYHRYLSWAVFGSRLFKPSKSKLARLRTWLMEADQRAQQYFSNRVLIMPVYHTTALPHGKVFDEIMSIRRTFLRYMPYVALPNVLGLPVLTVPVDVDDRNLPLGVQLISAIGNENAIFHFGKLLEKEFRGYVRCTKYD
ncbi:MAG: amidase [Bacillota bacterium]